MSIYDNDWGDVPARTISRAEQQETGLVKRASNFVAPVPAKPIVHVPGAHEVRMEMQPSTQSVVHVQTSATDRAKGFHLAFMPIAAGFGLCVVLISLFFDNSFFSLVTFALFWITFVLTWLAGWVWTNVISPEFAGLYHVKRQWDNIDNEQYERWEHYKWLSGRANNDKRN